MSDRDEVAEAFDCQACAADLLRHPDRDAACRLVARQTERSLADTGRGLDLTDADLHDLNLKNFDLRGATLNRANLCGADLSGADLSRATMICPSAERTRFRGANLKAAYVHALAA